MSKRRKSPTSDRTVTELTNALLLNGKAYEEGPRRRSWTLHDLKQIKPLTPTQAIMFQAYEQGKHICAHGSTGTGKTYLSLFLSLNDILGKMSGAKRIIIVRSAVPGRDIGFMPGTLEEKMALYERPYKDMFTDLLGKYSSYEDMKERGLVEFCTTSFVRGLTWDNAIIIIDEFQNMTMSEIDSVLTRLGENSRIILCGDIKYQCDLIREPSCAFNVTKILETIPIFSVIWFTIDDIVRSEFVKSWISARETLHI